NPPGGNRSRTYTQPPCGTPTATPTASPSPTATRTPTATPTASPSVTPTPTCTPSSGKIYNIAGFTLGGQTTTTRIYDIATNIWTTGAVVPTPVTGPGSTVFQGKLYLFGGGAPFPTTTTATQIYDPVANSWSAGPNMVVARLWFYGGARSTLSIDGPGGDTSPGIPINNNELYNGTSCANVLNLPFASRGPFCVSDGTYYYIGGGYDGSTVHADLLRYDPVANTYTTLAP